MRRISASVVPVTTTKSNQIYNNCNQDCDQHADGWAFGDGKEPIVNNPGYEPMIAAAINGFT